ncbi:MAG: formate dehydrogenase subunit delta [Rhodopila sp.]
MADEKLAYMANQIGRFFKSQKADTAVDAIHDHLTKFWDRRMRQAIVAQLAEDATKLDPLVRQAVDRLSNTPTQ